MAEAFSVFDPTGSGTLGWAAFKDAVYTLGMPFSNESFLSVKGVRKGEAGFFFVCALRPRFLTHGPGSLQNVAEKDFKCDLAKFKMLFLQLSASLPASNANDDIKAAFAAMDSDRTGKISKVCVRVATLCAGGTLTPVSGSCALLHDQRG